MSENPLDLSESEEAAYWLRRLVEPAPAGSHIETLIRNAARKLGWTYTRGKDVWYGQARTIRAREMDTLRNAVRQRGQPSGIPQQDLSELYDEIRQRLTELELTLARARGGSSVAS
jgi:hypothetical protein